MKITIIGSGNIATFFATKFAEANHELIQIISPTIDHAAQLANHFHCSFSSTINEINDESDVYFLAVKDDTIPELISNEILKNKTLIHTAGSITLDDLQSASSNIGCMWCMYSINKKHLPTRTDIPLIINASNEATLNTIKQLASAISNAVYSLSDNQKSNAHLAAVFANNFANYMFTIGQDILNKDEIPFQLLVPLIENTVEKLNYSNPDQLQTGPAIRNDLKTIEKHEKLLKTYPEFEKIYQLLTRSIQKKYLEENE